MLYLRRWNLLVKLKLRRVIDMTIDEMLKRIKEKMACDYNISGCDTCNISSCEDKDIVIQLAEWLEDYKRIKMLIPIEQALKAEYNKAIDDFVKAIVDRGLSANDDKYCITHYDNYLKVIKELAEQLKAGGINETN